MDNADLYELQIYADRASLKWNDMADGYNQWDALDLGEKLTLIIDEINNR